jgi:hypothetical protein
MLPLFSHHPGPINSKKVSSERDKLSEPISAEIMEPSEFTDSDCSENRKFPMPSSGRGIDVVSVG